LKESMLNHEINGTQSGSKIEVLDHGYVQHIESWGSDERIIESARMSTNKGFQGWTRTCSACAESPIAGTVFIKQFIDDGMGSETKCEACDGTGEVEGDTKLLRYLWEHHHMTPFEMAGATFEIQAPIMVFREWHRHRTQSYNEMSGRYTELPNLYYIPGRGRLRAAQQSKKNKQSSEGCFSEEMVTKIDAVLRQSTEVSRNAYEALLEMGVAREVARLVLPVNQYSRMRASANLRNWLAFLDLRVDETAQWEIRQFAGQVHAILGERFPRTLALFNEHFTKGD
jgi:thymidylate synthase (FAD)